MDNAADDLELIAVSKRPTRLVPHGTVVCTNLEPSVHEATTWKRTWCVKLMYDAHVPEIISGQLNVVKTYLKARYRLSDLLRDQRNDKMTSNLKRWIKTGAPDKGDLEGDSYKILKQFYLKRKDLLYLNKDGNARKWTRSFTKKFISVNTVIPERTDLWFTRSDGPSRRGQSVQQDTETIRMAWFEECL